LKLPETTNAAPAEYSPHHHAHAHAQLFPGAMSRRRFMGTTAGAAGAVLTSSLWWPAAAAASEHVERAPRPIPGGIDVGGTTFHVFLPGSGNEPSTITDFKGLVGLANIGGTGTGRDLTTGKATTLVFDADMRFMKGTFVDNDGHRRHGTFGFV